MNKVLHLIVLLLWGFLTSMALVESIPLYMDYKGNATFGIPLEKVWKSLISMATQKLDVVSFYWSLTGEDTGLNSSCDIPVSP